MALLCEDRLSKPAEERKPSPPGKGRAGCYGHLQAARGPGCFRISKCSPWEAAQGAEGTQGEELGGADCLALSQPREEMQITLRAPGNPMESPR